CAAGAGEGRGGVLSAGRPEQHPLPTSPLSAARPKGRGKAGLSPSLAPQAQGRAGEGCFLPGVPQSTPSQPPPCPLRGQSGGAKRLVSPPCGGRRRGGLGRGAFCRALRKAPPPNLPLDRYAAKGEGPSGVSPFLAPSL